MAHFFEKTFKVVTVKQVKTLAANNRILTDTDWSKQIIEFV